MAGIFEVLPFDPVDQDLLDRLDYAGFQAHDEAGRFPTMNELLDVLSNYKNLALQPPGHKGEVLIHLNQPDELEDACIQGRTDSDGLFHFQFLGWQHAPLRMLEILRRLSAFCGPLVLQESHRDAPVFIALDTDVEAAFQVWQARCQDKP